MYEDRQPFERPSDSTGTAIKVGIAIFLAVTASWILREAYTYWQIQQIGNAFARSSAEMQAQSQEHLRQIQEQQALAIARMEEQRAIAEQQKAQAELERTQLIQQQNIAMETAREQERLKAQAWDRYFKPRPECENPRNNEFVQCGNEYIRAKQKFEIEWAAKNNK